MRKVLIGLVALFSTSPAFASIDHWTCSNDQTVMYMVLDTTDGVFMLWDSDGKFLAGAKFTGGNKTANGLSFLTAVLKNGLGVGIAKRGDNLILAFTKGTKQASATLICD